MKTDKRVKGKRNTRKFMEKEGTKGYRGTKDGEYNNEHLLVVTVILKDLLRWPITCED